ncbi:MAG: hypothetical protein Kow0074_12970 [Candidatus Zixiibacteriota bacterium]
MKRLYAWGMLAWALAWQFLPPQPNPSIATFWWLGGIGTLLIILAGWNRPQGYRWSWLTLIATLILGGFGWIWWEEIFVGPVLLAAGGVCLILMGRNRRGGQLGDGLVVAGTIATLQLVGLYLFIVYLGPRGHGAAIPTDIIASSFQLAGVNAAALPDGLRLISTDRLYHIVPSPNNMGMYVFLQAFLGLIGLSICGKMRVRHLFAGFLTIGIFAVIRYIAVGLWDYANDGMVETFWSASILAWTTWPLALFLQRFMRPGYVDLPSGELIPRSRFSTRRFAVAIAATLVAVTAWTAYESYHPPGHKMQGRILLDELHSDWEWSEMPFDTLWYGQQSTYNFYSLAEFWDKHFHLDRGYDSLTPELLADYDVVILKVPTQPYAPSEIDAVLDFVERGGGLVLIGEHTNVFGYATFLNPVATRVGQRFIADIIYDLQTGDLNLYEPPKLLPHPVVQNMPTMLWGGPCSLYGTLGARPAVIATELKSLPADYTQRNFFPERVVHTSYRYGMFSLIMTSRHGKGRIVTFTDSTIWSNFFVFLPGKVELALSMVDYVNRYDPFPYWRILTFLFAVAAFIVGAVAASGLRIEGWLWMAAMGVLAFGLSARVIGDLNHANYPLPKPHTPFPQLNFEGEHSQFFLPEHRLARQADKDFSTFYLWTQRVDIVPRKFPTLEEALAQPGGQIIIDPVKPYDQEELDQLKEFVEQGGTLYVLDGPHNTESSSDQVMALFGLAFDMTPIRQTPDMVNLVENVLWRDGGRVIGGEPILAAPDSSVSCAKKSVGKGLVIAYANSNAFERKVMGYTSMIPNPIQSAISRFEYHLMTYLNYPPKDASAGSASSRSADDPDGQ